MRPHAVCVGPHLVIFLRLHLLWFCSNCTLALRYIAACTDFPCSSLKPSPHTRAVSVRSSNVCSQISALRLDSLCNNPVKIPQPIGGQVSLRVRSLYLLERPVRAVTLWFINSRPPRLYYMYFTCFIYNFWGVKAQLIYIYST